MTNPLPTEPPIDDLNRVQILAAMGMTAIALFVVARLWLFFFHTELLAVQWSGLSVLLGVGLGVGITAASSLVYYLWDGYRRSADFYLALILRPLAWPDLIWLGLLPGLSEELLFRGVMLMSLGFNGPALVLSSICFGVLHFSGSQHWSYVIWATVIGFVLGYSAIATGNLLVPIVAHITTNLISSLAWKWRMLKAL